MNSVLMKRTLFILLALTLCGAGVLVQDGEIVYVDYPEVEIKRPGGVAILADFGDALRAGDSVITTRFGEAEIARVKRYAHHIFLVVGNLAANDGRYQS